MIATSRFVFLHLHKSGGSFINDWLLRCCPDARRLGYHLPRRLTPPELAHLPTFGFVRNPWSYYVSWFAFQSARPNPNALYEILSDSGHLGFAGTIRNMLDLGAGSPRLDALLAALPASYANHGLNLPSFALAEIRDSGQGFYSFLHDYLFGGREGTLLVGRMEQLRHDLLEMLEAVGQPVDAAMRDDLMRAPPINASQHHVFTDYYDAELRELVAVRDRRVIERYGYGFRCRHFRS